MTYSDIELKRDTKRLLPVWGKYVDEVDFDKQALFVNIRKDKEIILHMAEPSQCLLGELHNFSNLWDQHIECNGCAELDRLISYTPNAEVTFRIFLEKVIKHIESDHKDWVASH